MANKLYFATCKGYYLQLEETRYSADCTVYHADGRICEFIGKRTREEVEEALDTYFSYGNFDYELGEFNNVKEAIKFHKTL